MYGSPAKLLIALLPEYEWNLWKFSNVSNEYWKDMKNQRQFLDYVYKELNFKSLDDWYNITYEVSPFKYCLILKELKKHKGSYMLTNCYNSSIYKMLSTVYPEHNWKPWSFDSRGVWKYAETRQDFYENFKKEMNITDMEQWYQISSTVSAICSF